MIVRRESRAPCAIWDRDEDDAYSDPGLPLADSVTGALVQQGECIYLRGDGASPGGDRPFLLRLHLDTLETDCLFRSSHDSREEVVTVLDAEAERLLTVRESSLEPPNYQIRERARGTTRPLTSNGWYAQHLSGVHAELMRYTRADGLDLSAMLYLPPGYRGDRPLPTLVWAYPHEYASWQTAGQLRRGTHRFPDILGPSHLLLLTQGYAVIDRPAMPIVGAPGSANDTFIEQLIAAARAAVDAAVALGVTDRTRVGIGGYSYGACMAVSLLAHTDLFRMGIASSGAYNRTLMPFGFQTECRTFWEAPHVYARMSPIWQVPSIKAPLLLIHGARDDNPSTPALQSERLYQALRGHGATVRYVELPFEGHRFRARQSILHILAEMCRWANDHLAGDRT